MAFRLYLVPQIGTGDARDQRRAKYISALGVPYTAMDFGFQPVFLVAADLSPANDAAVVANADVFAFPFDLQATISGGAVNQRKTRLEDFFIPGDGVTNGMTEQACARYVAGLFQFMQRLNFVLGNEVFVDTLAKLNIQWSTVPIDPYQNAILQTAQSLGYDTSFIQSNTQVRAILKNFADQWGAKPFHFGAFSI